MNVAEIMQTSLVTSPPEASVLEVAQLLTQRGVGACLITEDGRLAGIFTERDLLHLVATGEDVRDRPVAGVMTRNLTMAPPDAEVLWAADTMRRLGRAAPPGRRGRPCRRHRLDPRPVRRRRGRAAARSARRRRGP